MKKNRVLILGLGCSGQALVRFFNRSGQKYWTYDDCHKDSHFSSKTWINIDWRYVENIYISPGFSFKHPVIQMGVEKNIPLSNEIDFALSLLSHNVKVLAITGSNGKSTVATILYKLIKNSQFRVHLLGNIGTSLLDKIDNIEEGDYVVLELSSFQLEHCRSLKSRVSVILNIFPTHQKRYQSFFHYCKNKVKITQNQTIQDLCILPFADDCLKKWIHSDPRVCFFHQQIGFGRFKKTKDGVFFKKKMLFKWEQLSFKGEHNRLNIMVVLMILDDLDFDMNVIGDLMINIDGLDHRIEYVRFFKELIFINDSKATNAMAVLAAVKTMQESVRNEETELTLILGGRPQDNYSLAFILSHLPRFVKNVVIYGEVGLMMNQNLCSVENFTIHIVKNISIAVHLSYQISKKNTIVMLSPGFVSFDLYSNFEERGDVFKQEVLSL